MDMSRWEGASEVCFGSLHAERCEVMAKKGKRPKRPQDHYGERAKKEGLPARSYYKLEEMDKKHRILSRGAKVLDLGCSPGSWMLYCARRVGNDGFVWGVDLKPVDQVLPGNAEAVVGDAYSGSLRSLSRA